MAGIFEFDGRVNLAKLFNWLGSLEGTTDGEVFEGATANGKVQLRAEGSFVEDGGAIFGDVTLLVMERDGAPLGGFAGPASLDAAGGGLVFDAALADGVTVTAGPGRDVLRGVFGAGPDSLDGGGGDDLLDAGGGDDRILGGGGDDRILGGGGHDLLDGGGGGDEILGGGGDDFLLGGAGRDRLVGGGGFDDLDGGGGNDVLEGAGDGAGDVLRGGAGNDRLIGDAGDRLIGGGGDDRIVSKGGPGVFIDAGPGRNALRLEDGRRNGEDVGFLFGDDGRTVIRNADRHDAFRVFADLGAAEAEDLFGTTRTGRIERILFDDLSDSLSPGGRRTTCEIGDMALVFKGFDGPPGALPEQFEVQVFVFDD